MTWNLLLISSVILLCILLHRISEKIGVPMLLAFIVLGMAFGTDGILKIPFDNYPLAENICSIALIFIMFYGGFGTNWNEARPVAVKSVLLSTLGVVITAALTGFFCYFVLKFSFLDSMLIGSVISSTDAASVFSILRSKNMGLKYGTASMLELESGSNDPCSYCSGPLRHERHSQHRLCPFYDICPAFLRDSFWMSYSLCRPFYPAAHAVPYCRI